MPAGNQEHIELALKVKVDAVYGGLKKWNARQRAANFTVQQYNDNIKKLHKSCIKFYLTINTPLLGNQIKEIILLFKEKTLELPDAVIAADIGFIIDFHKEFPSVEIHASTQLGTHCQADLKFLKNIGVSRAILARELTKEEIEILSEKQILELECFGWGAQCMSFSGLCFFGSFIGCGNGNLGRCIAPCRDCYTARDKKGQLLFIPDLNCVNILRKTKGISSIKIEGRRRKSFELKNILNMINDQKMQEQNGYILGKEVRENHLFSLVSQRKKTLYHISEFPKASKYDIFARFKDNKPIEFMEEKSGDCYYIYSQMLQPYNFKKKNIIIELCIEGELITEIRFILNTGEYKIFSTNELADKKIDIDELVDLFCSVGNDINIIKIQYQRNIEDKYRISTGVINRAYGYLLYLSRNVKYNTSNSFQEEIDKDIYVEVDSVYVAEELIKHNEKVIFSISCISQLFNIEQVIDVLKDKVIYKLPLFNWENMKLDERYCVLAEKEVMFTRWSQIYESRDINFKKKYIDYTVYVWNDSAVSYLDSMKVAGYTASPELSYESNFSIFGNRETQYIIAGEMPVMYTRMCFSHLYNCKKCNGCFQKHNLYNIDKQMDMTILCRDDNRMLINNVPVLNYLNKIQNTNYTLRYLAYGKTTQQIIETLEMLRSCNYYENMKRHSYWKDSFDLYNSGE